LSTGGDGLTQGEPQAKHWEWWIFFVCGGALLLIVSILVLICCCARCRRPPAAAFLDDDEEDRKTDRKRFVFGRNRSSDTLQASSSVSSERHMVGVFGQQRARTAPFVLNKASSTGGLSFANLEGGTVLSDTGPARPAEVACLYETVSQKRPDDPRVTFSRSQPRFQLPLQRSVPTASSQGRTGQEPSPRFSTFSFDSPRFSDWNDGDLDDVSS